MQFPAHYIHHPILHHILLVSVLAFSQSACTADNTPGSTHRSAAQTVQTQQLLARDLQQVFETSASIQPIKQVKISNQLAGQITQINVFPGDRVNKNQLLLALDDRLSKAELDKASAQLKQAQLNLQRLQNLELNKLSSEDEIARAQTALEIARADLAIQTNYYQQSKITAPFSGIISERYVEVGDTVTPYTPLLNLINIQQFKIQASVSAQYLAFIEPGDSAQLYCPMSASQAIKASISRVYPAIDTASQQAQIEILWPATDTQLVAGQLCRIQLRGKKVSALSLPDSAIQYDLQSPFVYKVQQGRAIKVAVTTGIQQKNMTEITQGLQAGDEVVIAGFLNLSDNTPVTTGANK